jgi:hypothetical protein
MDSAATGTGREHNCFLTGQQVSTGGSPHRGGQAWRDRRDLGDTGYCEEPRREYGEQGVSRKGAKAQRIRSAVTIFVMSGK